MKLTSQNNIHSLNFWVAMCIIGFLIFSIVPPLQQAQIKTKYSRAAHELQQLTVAVIFAQGESGNTLQTITGTGWSLGWCPEGVNLQYISETSDCYQRWNTSLQAIITASGGLADGLEGASRDPWGSPYLLDENEGELSNRPCRHGTLSTAGHDGIRNTSDDYIVSLPFRTPQCAQ